MRELESEKLKAGKFERAKAGGSKQ